MRALLAILLAVCASVAHGQDGWWYDPDGYDRDNEGVVLDLTGDRVTFALYTHWGPRAEPGTPPTVSPAPPESIDPFSTGACDPNAPRPPTVSPAPPEPPAPIALQCDAGFPYWVIGVADEYDSGTGLASGQIYFSPNFLADEAEAFVIGNFFYVDDPVAEEIVIEVSWVQNLFFDRCASVYGTYELDRLINPNLARSLGW